MYRVACLGCNEYQSLISFRHAQYTLQLHIPYLTGQTEKSMNEVIGHVYYTLEGRFTHVRTRETNLGW